jgi:hypothetical protein
MSSLEKIVLEEQLFVFLRFLEINGFIELSNFIDSETTKEDIIQSIIFNFILDYYSDMI